MIADPLTAPPVLIVDDDEHIRTAVVRQLQRAGYDVREAADAAGALHHLREEEIGIVLCDIGLPGQSGLDLIGGIRQARPDAAIVMLTGQDDPAVARIALEHGACDYVIKPFARSELLISVANGLRRRELEIENRRYRDHLESLVVLRTKELRRSREEVISRLAHAADYKDSETASHIERMALYSELLARKAGLTIEEVELIRLAAPMHDIGKIGIPDAVLTKPGKYDSQERVVMQRHAEIGYRILQGSESELVDLAATVAYTHHEWFDGSGYPRALVGGAIPIAGRIVAIADVFDALTTQRVYKPAYTVEQSVEMMVAERARHFDPELLDLFLGDVDAVLEIRDGTGSETLVA